MQTQDYNQTALKRKTSWKNIKIYDFRIPAAILFICVSSISASCQQPQSADPGFPFEITIMSGDESFNLNGEAEIVVTPSSYSINMIEDNGRCVIHMLNFTTAPGPGTYNVEDDATMRTAMVCLLEKAEPRERLVSHSGTFTITELNNIHLKGHFDMILKGPVSGKDFHFSGKVTADMVPTHLQFRPQ